MQKRPGAKVQIPQTIIWQVLFIVLHWALGLGNGRAQRLPAHFNVHITVLTLKGLQEQVVVIFGRVGPLGFGRFSFFISLFRGHNGFERLDEFRSTLTHPRPANLGCLPLAEVYFDTQGGHITDLTPETFRTPLFQPSRTFTPSCSIQRKTSSMFIHLMAQILPFIDLKIAV